MAEGLRVGDHMLIEWLPGGQTGVNLCVNVPKLNLTCFQSSDIVSLVSVSNKSSIPLNQ